ncbi:hypothetical protein Ae201684_005374 [Aphanomyces euteiches]|uniref:F-box domain-containing protein n=1 Tax=Aphanomyces euteiches TaxID=100861 RepID=A0A6G0XEX5_9STRA|nr:hypothetical protein Ae201684_005374 [Aphanomyces euteiches]KAH9157693.1 hypothetical protein AeRB84_000503 [Aphanomyces euteiches]
MLVPPTVDALSWLPVKLENARSNDALVSLPTEIIARIVKFLHHLEIHQVESTHSRFRLYLEGYNCWKQEAMRRIVFDKAQWFVMAKTCGNSANYEIPQQIWKRLSCLADLAGSRAYGNEELIDSVLKYSSADRDCESPVNTLQASKCWNEIQRFSHNHELVQPYNLQELSTFSMYRLLTRRHSSLGETIQMLCGCSSGNSCYWSSAATTSPDTQESIFYRMRGNCIVRAIGILPYRVFWHPGAPTYGPSKVSFSFYANLEHAQEELPFYSSPTYNVINDMVEQTFQLPMRVLLQDGYISVNLIGRQRAQTFNLPTWMQTNPDDNVPKYYCCLSQVSAKGIVVGHAGL